MLKRMIPGMVAWAVALSAPAQEAAAPAGEATPAAVEVYRRVSPAVVAVESLGTGVIIDPDGLVLSSTKGVPPRERVHLHFAGGTRRAGRVIARAPAYEVALVRIEAEPGTRHPFVPLAAADPPPGRVVYTLGNAFRGITREGQVSISAGLVTGAYGLPPRPERKGGARDGPPAGEEKEKATETESYTGPVLEISAAVNPGMSGAPVVDREGRLVGMATLNFDESRWLGTAVPVEVLAPVIEALKAGREPPAPAPVAGRPDAADDGAAKDPAAPPARAGFLGVTVEDDADGGAGVVSIVPDSPADRVDVREGDRIVAFNGEAVADAADFRRRLRAIPAGKRIALGLRRGEERIEKQVELGTPSGRN